MNATSTLRSPDHPGQRQHFPVTAKLVVTTLVTNAALYVFLIAVMTFVDHDKLLVPLLLILVGDSMIAAGLLWLRRRWLLLVAIAYLGLMLLGSAPHDVSELVHPSGAVHFIFAFLAMIIPPIGMIIAAQSFLRGDLASTGT